jgi:5-methyltetrahydropteroyltriglutamate--homocysteine methyltransferase
MARGAPGAPALDMSKFFDSNYHFMVPELAQDFAPAPDFSALLERLARGQAALGRDVAVPMMVRWGRRGSRPLGGAPSTQRRRARPLLV